MITHKNVEHNEQGLQADINEKEEQIIFIRRALNYALWSFQRYTKAKPYFIEKASKSMYELLHMTRNSRIEMNCLFVYWILHELMFNIQQVEDLRITSGIDNIKRIAAFYGIEPLFKGARDARSAHTCV